MTRGLEAESGQGLGPLRQGEPWRGNSVKMKSVARDRSHLRGNGIEVKFDPHAVCWYC